MVFQPRCNPFHSHYGNMNLGHCGRHTDVALIGHCRDVAGFRAGNITARKPDVGS